MAQRPFFNTSRGCLVLIVNLCRDQSWAWAFTSGLGSARLRREWRFVGHPVPENLVAFIFSGQFARHSLQRRAAGNALAIHQNLQTLAPMISLPGSIVENRDRPPMVAHSV